MTPDIATHRSDPHERIANAAYLRTLREGTGLTHKAWAALMGCSTRKLERIESGSHVYDYATQYLWEALAYVHALPNKRFTSK